MPIDLVRAEVEVMMDVKVERDYHLWYVLEMLVKRRATKLQMLSPPIGLRSLSMSSCNSISIAKLIYMEG